MPEIEKIEELTNGLKTYVQTNIELFKLEATERTSVLGSRLISILLVGMALLLFVLFLSISAGFLLAHYFNDTFTGFALVTAFYFLLSIILLIGRRKLIEKPLCNTFIQRILKK